MPTGTSATRRDFLTQATTAAVAVGISSQLSAGLYAAGSDSLKVGLVGCGGRGTGAAGQALEADSGAELVAMADAFDDQLQRARKGLQRQFNKEGEPPRVNVTDDHCFVGLDAYRRVVDLSDVVLLASTPHFRPRHLKAAVEAGKHVFCEKPVAVDAPGIRSVLESVELARRNKTSLVSGLCWRYDYGKRATFEQLHNGVIGDITAMQCSYNSTGVWDPRRTRDQCDSEMEYQLRNWYYYTWLSGDFNVEQHIHSLDKMMWAMHDEPPTLISGSGGRQVRTDPKYGNIYDHFNVVYEWEKTVDVGDGRMEKRPGVKAFARCRHWANCKSEVDDYIFGTKGSIDVMKHAAYDLEGNEIWKYEGPEPSMYQVEHDELFASIRGANPINNGDYMCKSTMLAIAGRMSAYTGQYLTWDDVMNSSEDLSPAEYAWGDVPIPEVAIPGKTKFA